jgi:hypothetical protein
MTKLLSKLIYSRVIVVSLLGKDKLSTGILKDFSLCLQNYNEESIRHKNQDVF